MTKPIFERHPLGPYAVEFLESLREERRLQGSSLQNYERELRLLLELLPQPTETSKLKTHLRSQKPATAVRKLGLWRRFFEGTSEVWQQTIAGIKMPKIRQKLPRFLTDEEVFRLEQACYRSDFIDRDRTLIALMLQLGLRLAEVLQLRFKDIESGYLKVTRKGDKEQRLPLTASLQNLLRTYQRVQNAGPAYYLFEGRAQERLSSRGAQKILDRLAKEADLQEKISPHALRHTFASQLASRGASLVAIKEILGHRRLQTTERYLHVTPQHLQETLQLLNR